MDIKEEQMKEEESASQKGAEKTGAARNQYLLPAAILIAALMVSGALIYTKGGGGRAPDSADILEARKDDHILGDANAPLAIVEYSDFQCPFCRKFYQETLPRLKEQYIDTGRAKLVYRHMPLSFHPAAIPSAYAVECAEEQGKFWDMHDMIFERQAEMGRGTVQFGADEINAWANEAGLDMQAFQSCMQSGKYDKRIRGDINDASALGVTGTPVFFVGNRMIVGAQPSEVFQSVLEPMPD